MGQEPDQIRSEIDETRGDMTDTARAIGDKADVPGRMKGAIQDKRDEWFGEGGSASQTGDQAKRQAGRLKSMAEDNPLGLAVGGFAVGFLAGVLLPSTDFESERVGPVAEDVKQRAVDAGERAYERGKEATLERGKEVAKEAAGAAMETAQHDRQETHSREGSSR